MKIRMLTAIGTMLVLMACNKSDTAEMNAEDAAVADNAGAIADTTKAGTIDAAFVAEAMQGDNSEVAIGELAQAEGTSQEVKDFGKLLVADHGAHKQELRSLAETAGLAVTDEPSAEGKANLEKLKTLSGAKFDDQFKSMMIEDHTKDIAKYEKQAASGHAQTAALARKTLPVLRKHLDAAKAL